MTKTPTRPSQHPPIDLFMAKEAAAVIGVAVPNLKAYDPVTHRGIRGLPEPVCECIAGRIWHADDIKAFAKVYKAQRARGNRPSNNNGGDNDGQQADSRHAARPKASTAA